MTTYDRYETVDYVLPSGTKINPRRPETAEFYDARLVGFAMRKLNEARTYPTRLVTSHGTLGGPGSWKIGERYSLRHDQTNALLGDYEVVGTVVFATGEVEGDVPDRKISHCVFK
jgi:hypothetical protein